MIPARIDYTLDLSPMGRDRLTWDAAKARSTCACRRWQLSHPNLDEGRAQYLREGVWISRTDAGQADPRQHPPRRTEAASRPANPVLMGLARNAAKDAIRQNLADPPCRFAGYAAMPVSRVRFDGREGNDHDRPDRKPRRHRYPRRDRAAAQGAQRRDPRALLPEAGNPGPRRFRRRLRSNCRRRRRRPMPMSSRSAGSSSWPTPRRSCRRRRSSCCPTWTPGAASRIRARPRSSRPSARPTPITSR